MKDFIVNFFFVNWQRKLTAFFIACATWFLVSRSIPESSSLGYPILDKIALTQNMEAFLPLDMKLPIIVVSQSNDKKIDSLTLSSDYLEAQNNFYYLKLPLFVQGVSPLFLEIVKEKLALFIYLDASNEPSWSIECTDQRKLEESYINACIAKGSDHTSEAILRSHFRTNMHQLSLFTEKKRPLNLGLFLDGTTLYLKVKR